MIAAAPGLSICLASVPLASSCLSTAIPGAFVAANLQRPVPIRHFFGLARRAIASTAAWSGLVLETSGDFSHRQ